jgi:tetratricopeptide (TPR) repeat protein
MTSAPATEAASPIPDESAPIDAADSRGADEESAGRSASRSARRLWRPLRWFLLLGLLAINAWWYWRASEPQVSNKVIETWLDQHRGDDAERALKRRLARSPHDGEAHALLAKLLAQRGDTLACAQELHEVPDWWPNKGKWALMEATAFKQVDRMADAEAAWQWIVKDDPLHPVDEKVVTTAVLDLLELYAVEARWSDAARLIWNIYDRLGNPRDQEVLLVMRLRTEMERIMPVIAAEKLRKYIEADPHDWEARRALAKVNLVLSKPEEAKELVESCVRDRPADPRIWADYLTVLNDLGELDSLRSALEQIPPEVLADSGILKSRAWVLERDRKWAEAASLYRQLIQAHPWEADAYYRLALVEERLGQTAAARDHRQKSEAMRAARQELTDVFQKVLDLRKEKQETPAMHQAVRRLAKTCEKLGWARDAEAWAKLVPPES